MCGLMYADIVVLLVCRFSLSLSLSLSLSHTHTLSLSLSLVSLSLSSIPLLISRGSTQMLAHSLPSPSLFLTHARICGLCLSPLDLQIICLRRLLPAHSWRGNVCTRSECCSLPSLTNGPVGSHQYTQATRMRVHTHSHI